MTPRISGWAALTSKLNLIRNCCFIVMTALPLVAMEELKVVHNPLMEGQSSASSRARLRLFETDRISSEHQIFDREKYRQLIFSIIEDGTLVELKRIYRKDTIIYGKFGMTPMYFAALKGRNDMIEFMLSNAEDPNQQNTHRFRTRSQGARRKNRQAVGEARDAFRDQLVDAGGFTLDIFSSGIFNRIGSKHSASKARIEEIISAGGVRGSVKINYGTPIFAVVNKENITDTEITIAENLLRHGATVSTLNAYNQSPIDILEMRLEHLAEGTALISPPCKHSFSLARSLYRDAIANTSMRRELFPIWFMFADSHTTARLIEDECPTEDDEKRVPHVAFFDGFAKWELDGVLPMPRDAFDRYTRAKEKLPEKTRFRMLLRYLYLYGKLEDEETHDTDVVLSQDTLSDLYKQSPMAVARAIFSTHRELFLAINPREIALKYARNDTARSLNKFLQRIDHLSSFVAYSIVVSNHREASFHFWHRVGEKLMKLNDLFGASCIVAGLRSPSVLRLMDSPIISLPDMQLYKNYVHYKQEALKSGAAVIPCVYHEGTRFQGNFESLSLDPQQFFVPDVETNLPQIVGAFMGDIAYMQERLQIAKVSESEWLMDLFRRLPRAQTSGFGVELLSLQIERTERPNKKSVIDGEFTPAEYWDTRDLWNWLGREHLEKFTQPLIEHGVNNGASFVEKMAVARSPRFRDVGCQEMHAVFGVYENVCRENDVNALGALPDGSPFPVNLFQNPKSSFQWIMWLRANGLENAIPTLIAQRIDTFHAFIDNEVRVGPHHVELKNIKPEHRETLDHLKAVFLALNERPDSVSNWRRLDAHAWLFQHGLSHVVRHIEADKITKADHFLSYVYLLWNFKVSFLLELGLNPEWVRPLFDVSDSTVFRAFLDEAREVPAVIRKRDRTSRLFFIRLLVSIGAEKTLPAFYKEGIRTIRKLKVKLHASNKSSHDDVPDELRLNIEELELARYGLSVEQITAILPFVR